MQTHHQEMMHLKIFGRTYRWKLSIQRFQTLKTDLFHNIDSLTMILPTAPYIPLAYDRPFQNKQYLSDRQLYLASQRKVFQGDFTCIHFNCPKADLDIKQIITESFLFFIRHFSNCFTLHCNALAAWATCLDLRLIAYLGWRYKSLFFPVFYPDF